MRFIVLLSVMMSFLVASEASYNRGETLFFSHACSSCHGPAAEGSTSYPKLANKKSAYLRKKLTDFRAGKASSVSQQMMSQFAEKLSDKNIDDLVNFLANHKQVKMKEMDDAYLGGVGS